MTASPGPESYTAQDNSQVAAMGDHASVDSVFFVNGGQLVYNPGDTPRRKYEVGVRSLKGGQPQKAQELISEAMTDGPVSSEILFYWLVAMVSGRVVQEFTPQEVVQLRSWRHACTLLPGDPWADGVRLLYQLLDSALLSLASHAGHAEPPPDMSVIVKEIDGLRREQRDMIWPHLDIFLTGGSWTRPGRPPSRTRGNAGSTTAAGDVPGCSSTRIPQRYSSPRSIQKSQASVAGW